MVMQTMEDQTTIESIRRLEERMDERFYHVNVEFGRINTEFGRIDARFQGIDARFQVIDGRFQGIETDIRELRAEQKGTAKELRAEIKESSGELRADIKSMQRTMLYGFFSLAGLMLTFAGFQLA